jgi:hypothetical protein
MKIRIVHYVPSVSPLVEAFVDIEVDSWVRYNGLNLLRDGTLRPAQLTPFRNGQRLFRDAVQILDTDLAQLVAADILAAIRTHVALLPAERRSLPPLLNRPPKTPPKLTVEPVGKLTVQPAGKLTLPPPERLLARRKILTARRVSPQ